MNKDLEDHQLDKSNLKTKLLLLELKIFNLEEKIFHLPNFIMLFKDKLILKKAENNYKH